MPDLASYMQTVIEQLEADKKRSAAHTYTYALKSIAEFYGGAGMPMPVDEVFTPGRLKEYEEWMRREGMRKRKREPKGLRLEYHFHLYAELEGGISPDGRRKGAAL